MAGQLPLLVMSACMCVPVVCRAADGPAADAASTDSAGAAIKRDAKLVAAAAKDGAQQIAAAAKEVVHEVAVATQEGAEHIAAAAKRGADRTRAAAKPEKKSAKPEQPAE